MARFQTSISINKTNLVKLKNISSQSKIIISKIIQILLVDFFKLNKKKQKTILKNHKKQSLISLSDNNINEIATLNIFINVRIP